MAQQLSSYFKQLKFQEKFNNSFVAKYLSQPRLTLLLILGIIFIGLASYTQLPRVLNPDIKIPIIIVSTVLPGASPTDVESLITIPLEDAVQGVQNIDTIQSSSRDSVSIITMQFESGVEPEKARQDVQTAVDSVNDLPTDAQAPSVQKIDFQNIPVWTFAITSKGSTANLTQFAENLQKQLEDIPSINRVDISGLEKQEIQILVKPEAISTYNLNPLLLQQSIKSSLNALPAGNVQTGTSSFGLSIDPSVKNIEDLRHINVNYNDSILSLGDITVISERSAPGQIPAYLATHTHTPQRSVTFDVYKVSTANIDTAVHDAQKEVDTFMKPYQGQFSLHSVLNTSELIDEQFNELLKDYAITVVLIFFTLFIFLGTRQAIVAAVTTPLTFLIVFIVMNVTGIAISFLSLFSLLLALGLLVDDTIVVISAMTAYHRTGKFTPFQTGVLVWNDFFIPILTTTLTTVWAFFPLLLASGIIGEFIKAIPIVVSTSLLASIGVALFVTLPFIVFLLNFKIPKRVLTLLKIIGIILVIIIFYKLSPKNYLFVPGFLSLVALVGVISLVYKDLFKRLPFHLKPATIKKIKEITDDGVIHFGRITNKYHSIIERILLSLQNRKKTIIIVCIFFLFSFSLLPLGFVVNEFFPKSNTNYLYITLELPSGTNSSTTQIEAMPVLNDLRKIDGVNFVTANIGRGFSSQGGTAASEENNILYTLQLDDKKISSIKLADELREKYKSYTVGKISVVEESGGPPAGSDLQINLYGDDLEKLDTYANKIQNYIKTLPGTTNIDKSIKSGTGKLVFEPDKQELTQTGLSQDVVGLWLRMYASGMKADTIKLDNQERDIIIRMSDQTVHPEGITSLMIPSQQGNISLSQLGHIHLSTNPTLITREDGKRTLSVTAGVAKGYSSTQLNQKLVDYAKTIQFDPGYSWKTGGANEENEKSVQSILQAMILSFLLILTTMVIQFQSFRRAFIVMLVIPLSISGVFVIFAITRTPLSFPALIGVLALFGIVVKNSILIVDKIVSNRKAGIPFVTAIADGASSRLEAIALTSFTAILGLIPITLSDPLWRGLGGAIISGLIFSGTIMLFFIPVVYYYLFHTETTKK